MVKISSYRVSEKVKDAARKAPPHMKAVILEEAPRIPEKQMCSHIIVKGKDKGKQCANSHHRGNGGVCFRHRKSKKQKECRVIITRGPRKGEVCGKFACLHRRKHSSSS